MSRMEAPVSVLTGLHIGGFLEGEPCWRDLTPEEYIPSFEVIQSLQCDAAAEVASLDLFI